jgi:ABC-type transport system involved in multi-copper enzyme maturation permease subunit
MSAIAAPAPADARDARPGLVRLTGVELRKMVDTRAGLWLLITTVGLTLAAVAIVGAAGEAVDHTFRSMLEVALAPSSVLLPIVGILLITSEWTQRTALVTFALVPQRGRVLTAKLLAGLLLALASFLICIAVAAVSVAILNPDVDGVWKIPGGLVVQDFLSIALVMVVGLAFGTALLASAPAIVLYFALPIAFAALGALSFFDKIADWTDMTRTTSPLTSELLSGTEWARAGVSMLVWLVLPLAIGIWRVRREELR